MRNNITGLRDYSTANAAYAAYATVLLPKYVSDHGKHTMHGISMILIYLY